MTRKEAPERYDALFREYEEECHHRREAERRAAASEAALVELRPMTVRAVEASEALVKRLSALIERTEAAEKLLRERPKTFATVGGYRTWYDKVEAYFAQADEVTK